MAINLPIAILLFCVVLLAFMLATDILNSSTPDILTPGVGIALINNGPASDKKIYRSAVYGVPLQTDSAGKVVTAKPQPPPQVEQPPAPLPAKGNTIQTASSGVDPWSPTFASFVPDDKTADNFDPHKFAHDVKWEEDLPAHQ